ncbi:MAG: cytidylate kinase-like family protein [Anaerolineae bacterium]|nr:cytidylate kinase-like family protein [Anaerolineae bacterium]
MTTVNISRQVGSEGVAIGKTVANALGYHFVDRNTIARVLSEYGMVDFKKVYESTEGFWDRFSPRRADIVNMLNRAIRAIARTDDVVIVGRGSYIVLEGLADVLNVRIQAPLGVRVQRVMAREGLDDLLAAAEMVKERDRARTEFVEFTYEVKWDDASRFDLVIDTSKVAPDTAAGWIIETTKALAAKDHGDQPVTRSIEIDSVLADFVGEKVLTR